MRSLANEDDVMTPLDARSRYLRQRVVDALSGAKRGHVGASFSLIEILRALYDDILAFRADEPRWPRRDRLILSKGHGCLALYALLADKGFLPISELASFCAFDSRLGGHPEAGKIPGVEASTGALGHGLSIGLGMALALRMTGIGSRVFVVMGDGEINEGSVWEAALSASKNGLDNLIAIIDYNKLQSFGPISQVLPLEPLAQKWRSFGFETVEVDGHDVVALKDVFCSLPFAKGKPSAVICHTVKGRGAVFAENNPSWHHKSSLDATAIAALRDAIGN